MPKEFEFDAPYSASFKDLLTGRALWLHHNGNLVGSFSVADFGGEQEAIEAAWNYAYGPCEDLPRERSGPVWSHVFTGFIGAAFYAALNFFFG